MLEAIHETANWSTARIRSIRDLLGQTAERWNDGQPIPDQEADAKTPASSAGVEQSQNWMLCG
jgi:hypothetical protein